MEIAIAAILSFALGGVLIFFIKKYQDEVKKKSARIEADKIVVKAKNEAARAQKDAEHKARDFETRARRNVEGEINKQKSQLKNKELQLERRIKETEEIHKSKLDDFDKETKEIKAKEEALNHLDSRLKEMEKKADQQLMGLKEKLESVARMTQDEAKRELISSLEEDARNQAAHKISQIEGEAQKEADRRARRIVSVALSRFASEYTSERTVSVLALSSDEMKGKIIGREGRNIRTLESLCGVDLIVDDTPEAVVISGFDPIRRELAKRTIVKLMEDGRVHPARIEEIVEKQRQDLFKSMKEEGDRAVVELGLGQMHPELVKLVGSLKYRSTNAQNVLNHSLEVAHISGLLASEMGMNVKLAKRAGLLHDIGKAIDHTIDGSHSFVGAEWAKKYGETDEVVHAIRAHHEEEKPNSWLAWTVLAANILSNSRPGARRPQMDNFIHRLEDIESIGNSFDGVLRTYALQAGRDVRVAVESAKVTDDLAVLLARDISRKIEREMPNFGNVKVTVVRESRAIEFAR